jgi:hypothetical protein
MAANPIPDAALYQITIAPGGTVISNGSLKITNQDSITFHNTSGFAVNIVFTGVFSPITNLQQGGTQAPNGGPALNTTINYKIVNASTGQQTGGPYSIEFGVGAMTVTVTNLTTNPDPIAVPPGGQVVFVCDAKYNIVWKSNGVPVTAWTPQPLQLQAGTNPPQTALPAVYGQVLTYIITNAAATRGGGTVNVGS